MLAEALREEIKDSVRKTLLELYLIEEDEEIRRKLELLSRKLELLGVI